MDYEGLDEDGPPVDLVLSRDSALGSRIATALLLPQSSSFSVVPPLPSCYSFDGLKIRYDVDGGRKA